MAPRSGSRKVVPLLRALAALSAVAIVACWISLGAHMGWSQTRIPVERTDAVTATAFTDTRSDFSPASTSSSRDFSAPQPSSRSRW